MKVKFPSKAGKLKKSMLERYYKVYYTYVLNIFRYMNADIDFVDDTAVSDGVFWVEINGKKVLIDYSDYLSVSPHVKDNDVVAYFKYHCTDKHKNSNKIHPFPPISFYDWEEYYDLEKKIKYKAKGGKIINRQRPYGNARVRRLGVQSLMKKVCKGTKFQFYIGMRPQLEFWNDVSDCMCAVFVPGCRNDMLDRAHMQYLGFGCAVICPPITTILPYWKKLVPGKHYVECDPDYAAIVDCCRWVDKHRKETKKIGRLSKKLFKETCTPEKVSKWMLGVIDGKYKR